MRLKLMKTFPAIVVGSLAAVAAMPHEAKAQARAVVTTDLNMRAGPSTQFPVVDVLPRGRTVTVHGCVRNLTWCDVTTRRDRGWVSARYLSEEQRRRPIADLGPSIGFPIITFQFGDYWDRHYSGRQFYRDRDRWRGQWDGPRRSRDADRRDWGRGGEPDRWDRDRQRREADRDGERWGDRRAPETTGSTVFELRGSAVEEAPPPEMRREERRGGRGEGSGARGWDGPPGHRDGHPGRGRGPRD